MSNYNCPLRTCLIFFNSISDKKLNQFGIFNGTNELIWYFILLGHELISHIGQ